MRRVEFNKRTLFAVLVEEERPVGGDTTLALEVYNDEADALLASTVGFCVMEKKSTMCVVGVYGSRRYGEYQVIVNSDIMRHDSSEIIHLTQFVFMVNMSVRMN